MIMEEWMWLVWLIIGVVSFIAEALTAAVVSVWLVGGALVALVFSLIPDFTPFWAEIIIFIGVSALLFVVLRPFIVKYMKKKIVKSNVDGMIGKRGIILTGCDALKAGEVTINGVTWTAIPANDDDSFSEGEVVKVAAIEGNKLLVDKTAGKADNK
ncbi:MAG: NfeD family protein [Bacilli bacterium]|nr:NfeD family protein [Bacilli bacterium]